MPVEYFELMTERVSGDEFVSMEAGSVRLLSASAVSDDSSGIGDIASSVFNFIIENSIGAGMANKELMDDLSWRYYHYTDKQDRLPLVATGNAMRLSDFDSWAEWDTYVRSNFLFDYPYRLVGFDDNKTWTSVSPNAELEYAKWYEYYEAGNSETEGPIVIDDYVYIDIKKGWCPNWVGIYQAFYDENGNMYYVNEGREPSIPESIKGKLTKSDYIKLVNIGLENFAIFVGIPGNNASDNAQITGRARPANSFTYVKQNGQYYLTNMITGTIPNVMVYSSNHLYYEETLGYYITLGFGNYYDTVNVTEGSTNIAWISYFNENIGEIEGDGSIENPVYPTYPQPDPPEKPEMPTYNINEGDTITNTTNNTYNITNTTTTVDLQPILDAIGVVNNNLISINQNIDEFEDMFSTLANDIRSQLVSIYDLLYASLENLTEQIDTWGYELMGQLKEANRWLEGIYYKRDTGGGPTAPDPGIDPIGYGTWWADLLAKLLGMLPQAVTDFVNEISKLSGVFPFSIPWDVSAILGLLAHDPVTPVFDLPLPSIGASGVTTVPVHIDCSDWDAVAALFRKCVFFYFAFNLALWTREGLKNWEV